ncbi:hypothetical protein D5F01_LYC01952 [Larimichthys crocea]|uniref:Uncharacterized protein n=1 Tax=Larimichthys crocea TaxID=215358 RepID=A0A6G0J726_LARCR|nr:hypothetical protein D5F01_LYC01952 [Larimichthys crocea]
MTDSAALSIIIIIIIIISITAGSHEHLHGASIPGGALSLPLAQSCGVVETMTDTDTCSVIQSQGRFGLGVTYRDGIPAAETPRPSSAAASRGVRINSTSKHPPCTPVRPHRRLLLLLLLLWTSSVQLTQASHPYSPSLHRNALQSVPTSSHQTGRCTKSDWAEHATAVEREAERERERERNVAYRRMA